MTVEEIIARATAPHVFEDAPGAYDRPEWARFREGQRDSRREAAKRVLIAPHAAGYLMTKVTQQEAAPMLAEYGPK